MGKACERASIQKATLLTCQEKGEASSLPVQRLEELAQKAKWTTGSPRSEIKADGH